MELAQGTVFAGYVVERLIGDGGMGSVYLARHPHLPKLEAVKLLRPELCRDPVFTGRFHREADTVAQLSHPHILPVHDRGSEDGQLWISMPYVDGRDAAAAILTDPAGLPPERAVHILGQIGSALDYAHRQRILHRDVKPANILLSPAPDADEPDAEWAFLTDFGIARPVEGPRLTAAGDVIATFHYASPEQIDGQELDHRSDIYSLGCVLYELLTGQLPFPEPSVAAAISAHLHKPPPRPSLVKDTLPAGFDQVVTTAMAKNPADRYQSCRELSAAAHLALTSAPASRSPLPRPAQVTAFDPDAPGEPAGHSPGGRGGPGLGEPGGRGTDGAATGSRAPAVRPPAVDLLTPPPTPRPPAPPSGSGTGPPPTGHPSAPLPPAPRRRSRHWWVLGVGAVLVALITAGAVVFWPPPTVTPKPAAGTVVSWGYGAAGQLGNGVEAGGSVLPVAVTGLAGVIDLSGGYSNGYALMSDNTVRGWGMNDQHQLGAVDGATQSEPVPVTGLTGVSAIAGGSGTGFALLHDGTVTTWGQGQQGQLGTGQTPADGGLPAPVTGLAGVTAISGGYTNGYARLDDGTVMAWGQGDHGQLGNGGTTNSAVPVPVTGLTHVTAISGGSGNGYALLDDGTVMAWGQGDRGQLGNGGTADSAAPVRVTGLGRVVGISGGSGNGYAMLDDGTVMAWGRGDQLLLGNGGSTDSATPVTVTGLTGATQISCRSENCYVLRSDGTVMGWGQGDNGQLGNGTTTDSAVPVPVSNLADIAAIAGGSGTGFAVHR